MIERLYIKNYLIIKEAEIEFTKGLNILTGETGAGKSIIIDALSLILGERAEYSKIKKEEDKLVVEGHFNFKNNKAALNILGNLLAEHEYNPEYVIIRRELFKKGLSRSFINDSPVSISDMKNFGNVIIDIHSQNEHQSLLRKETHMGILDNYCSKIGLFDDYAKEFSELKELIKTYSDIISKKDELISKKSFLDFELKEINNLSLKPEEDAELENELNKLENIENISAGLESALRVIYDEDTNAAGQINYALKELNKIVKYDGSLSKIISDLENSYILVKESSDSLSSYRDKLNFDNERTELVRKRLSDINLIKKKYGLNIDELLSKAESLEKELIFAENFDFEIEKLKKDIEIKKEKVFKKGNEISELRNKLSNELEKEINKLLKEIGLESAEFKVSLKNTEGNEEEILSYKYKKEIVQLGNRGFNDIEFIIKTNKGSEFAPLQKSASGGEISRIMLAIKTVLSEKDNIGILVFDEIDAGISGRVAQKAGKVLKSLSKTHQIICITHLPQIAAMSDKHFHVSKSENKNETLAGIKSLTENEKITEVAKLLSGEKVTDASRKSAIELINS